MKQKFSTEFTRRLYALEKAIMTYRTTGEIGITVFLLLKCALYCWCKSPVIKKVNK